MTALLGLLAVAGYQHRDKLAQMLDDRARAGGDAGGSLGGGLGGGSGRSAGLDGLLGRLGGAGAGGGLGALLGGGLGEMADRFRQGGHGEAMDSWVGTGPNRELAPPELERAIGPEALDDLVEQTGLPRDEILARLSRELPRAVDEYTPQGRLPQGEDFA